MPFFLLSDSQRRWERRGANTNRIAQTETAGYVDPSQKRGVSCWQICAVNWHRAWALQLGLGNFFLPGLPMLLVNELSNSFGVNKKPSLSCP